MKPGDPLKEKNIYRETQNEYVFKTIKEITTNFNLVIVDKDKNIMSSKKNILFYLTS